VRRAVGLYAAGAVLFIGAAFPFLWMLSTALKPSGEIFATPRFVPLSPTLENFWRLFADTSFLVFFRNSVVVAGATVLLRSPCPPSAPTASRATAFAGATAWPASSY
jgi:ABC-type glycerol-3-phosphate transport system permease component